MMIKLDSGDYVNTDFIERLWMINEHDGFIRFVNAQTSLSVKTIVALF